MIALVCALFVGLGFYLYYTGVFAIGWGRIAGTNFILSKDGRTRNFYYYDKLLRGDRVYLALVMDGEGQMLTSHARALAGKTIEGGAGNGESKDLLFADDGRIIFWSSSTRNGNRGNVVIDGQKFDLTRGALFLVSAKNKRTRVEQLTVDPRLLPLVSDAEKFTKMGTVDPRITAFLKSLPTEKVRR